MGLFIIDILICRVTFLSPHQPGTLRGTLPTLEEEFSKTKLFLSEVAATFRLIGDELSSAEHLLIPVRAKVLITPTKRLKLYIVKGQASARDKDRQCPLCCVSQLLSSVSN